LIDKEGKEKFISDSAAPIRDKESNIIGVVIVFRDVTENNRMEEELLKVKKLESVGILAGGIAHDFNNILAAIVGNINLALLDDSIKSHTRKLLIGAEKASLRAKNLTLQLLTFAKGGEPVKETSSVAEIITDSADFVLHGSNVVCRYNFTEDLWLVDIDKGQMSQVIQNIIINSRHAMPKGGTIDVRCENVFSNNIGNSLQTSPQKGIKITISDTGIGIPADVIDRIFDPYFSTSQKGSGLGLAISNSIIRKHDGRIFAQSTPGKQTTFTIFLPASTHHEKPMEPAEKHRKSVQSARILVMDDEELVRDVAAAMLVQLGHTPILVNDGTEALKTYQDQMDKNEPVHAVIMDLTIPGGVGGKDAVQDILAIDAKARVIVSSGYSNDPIMANCQQYGFVAAVVKPYQIKELEKILELALAAAEEDS
ncbi:MAG: response regulator, partial [Proteobacteria bacterium]|nr:response regulator [Pseudomonadota bacterium]